MLSPLETALIALLLVVLMFGMGATLTWERFQTVAREPKAFLIGTASQFGWMPLLAYLLAKGLDLPPYAALGLVVMGTCPGGTTSNLFAHLAKADVALSIAMTAASKVLGIVLMPLCLYLYARPFTEANMPIPYGDVVKTLIVLLVPVAIAMLLRRRYGERFASGAERVGSSAGMVLLLALVGISVVRNRALFSTLTAPMVIAALALGLFGMLAGALIARAAGLSPAQRRTVSFETGVQNSPLCFAILVAAFPGESQLELLKLPLLYALFVLIEASLATALYRWLDRREGALVSVQSAGAPLAVCLAIGVAASLGACSDDSTPNASDKPGSESPSTAGDKLDGGGSSSGNDSTSDAGSTSSAADAGSGQSSARGDASLASPADAALPTISGKVTYYQDVKPFMDAKCVRCHVAGTVAPFSLDTYDLAKEHGTIAKAAVMSGSMPPWMFKDGCNDYKGNFSLTPQEKATLYAWVDQGMAAGDASKPGAKLDIGEVGLSRVDVSLQIPEAYTSTMQQPDEYRCFPVLWPSKYTKDVFMTGYRAVPGNPRVVHHVEVYYIPKAQVQTVMQKDAADPGPGYTCFGGPGAGNGTVGGWAPGSPGYDYPPNVGIRIEAGSAMVIQVHYNTQTVGHSEPDQTKVEFKVDENVVEGGYDFWMNLAWTAGGMNIPAGKADVAFDWTADPTSLNTTSVMAGGFGGSGSGKPIMLYTAGIHMHNLGTTGYMHLKRKDGTRECIVELRDWDFHWQGGVRLQKPIAINPGDVIEMECRYDNSQANQPVYQGKQQAPRNVNWGENTTDEMCLGILLWGQQ